MVKKKINEKGTSADYTENTVQFWNIFFSTSAIDHKCSEKLWLT